MTKTNVMRLLDAAGIDYEAGEYEVDEDDLSGSHAADMMGMDHDTMFKTLVLKGDKNGYLVCCIPVDEAGPEKGGKGFQGQESGDDPYEGTSSADWLYARWLFPDRHEKEVPYLYRRNSADFRQNQHQRGSERCSGHSESGGTCKICGCTVCSADLEW